MADNTITPDVQPLLKAEYARLSATRLPYLQRARDCSAYTLPSLVPPEGYHGTMRLRKTFSSFGARCVNSLSSKLTLALFPAQAPFFKFVIDDATLAKIAAQQGGVSLRADIEKGLQSAESVVVDSIETTATRTPASEGTKHLIVAGNALANITPENSLRIFPLTQYVVKRDATGKVICIILEEAVSPMSLPPAIRQIAMDEAKVSAGISKQPPSADRTLRLYTGIYRRDTKWEIWQEVSDLPVPGSRNTQPIDACPWLPLRFTQVDGEDYGRGLVEEYLGELVSLEGLRKAIVKGTAAAARVIFLVKPNGSTKKQAFSRAETGDAIDGSEGDVTVAQTDHRADFATAAAECDKIKQDLSYAFALNQAIQRNAERVTAEEIRFMATELDSLLGGIYSLLSLEFQTPYLKRLVSQLEQAGKLPVLPKGTVKPVILTGIAALGRGADLDNLKAFVKDIVDLGGAEALQTYVNFGDLMKRLATSRGIKTDGLVKTDDEVLAAQQQEQMQQMAAQLGPNAINAAGGMAKQAMANGQPVSIPTHG